MLLFSDVPANTIYKWTEAKGKEVYLKPSGYTSAEPRGGFMGSNALALDKDGKLLICQHGDRRIASMQAPIDAPKTNFVTVAGEYNGKKINSPNDLFVTPAVIFILLIHRMASKEEAQRSQKRNFLPGRV